MTTDTRIPALQLSVAALARVVNELYAERDDNLPALCYWLHGYCLKVRHVWARVLEEHGIDRDLCLAVWNGSASDAQIKTYCGLTEKLRKHCGDENKCDYALTSVAKTMWHQLNIAHDYSRRGDPYLVMFIGDAGDGKTTILQAHEREFNHGTSTYVRARIGGIKAIASEIVYRCGGDPTQNYPRVMKQCYESFWSGRHLSVDEAHLLIAAKSDTQPRLEFIRGIIDIGRCSGCLAFTEDAFESGLAESRYNFRQLAWRGNIIRLTRFPDRTEDVRKADIRALLKFYCPNIDPSAALIKTLDGVGKHEMGGFGGIANVIRHASIESDTRGVKLTEGLLNSVAMMQYDPGEKEDAAAGTKYRAPGMKERTLQLIHQRRGKRRH